MRRALVKGIKYLGVAPKNNGVHLTNIFAASYGFRSNFSEDMLHDLDKSWLVFYAIGSV